MAPVDPAVGESLPAPLELPRELGVDDEPLRHGDELIVECCQPVCADGGDDRLARARNGRRILDRHRRGCLVRLRQGGLEPIVGRAQLPKCVRRDRLGIGLGDNAGRDELGRVLLADGRLVVDPLDHERLRVCRLVLLVVPEAAIADEVDHDVVTELPAIGQRQPNGAEGGLWIVGVDVDDRKVESLREVARVPRRASIRRVGREPDLVVRDQVQRATRRVAGEVRQVERLGDDTLPREGSVAMDQHRERNRRIVDGGSLGAVGLLGARPPLDHGIDRFEMARIRRDRDLDLACRRPPRARSGEVVLDVAGPALGIGDDRFDRPLALELTQDRLVRPSDGVRERVQPATVRHPDHDLVGAVRGRQLDRLVEHRHERVEPLERELLLTEKRLAQVLLESLGLGEPLEQRPSLVGL